MFSAELKSAINAVSQDVAADMQDSDEESVAESVLGCLEIYRPDVRGEVTRLVAEHGYQAVLAAAAKEVSVW